MKKQIPSKFKVLGGIMGLVNLALVILAWRDIIKRKPEQINGKKWVWMIVSLVEFVGPILYYFIGRKKSAPDWDPNGQNPHPETYHYHAEFKPGMVTE